MQVLARRGSGRGPAAGACCGCLLRLA